MGGEAGDGRARSGSREAAGDGHDSDVESAPARGGQGPATWLQIERNAAALRRERAAERPVQRKEGGAGANGSGAVASSDAGAARSSVATLDPATMSDEKIAHEIDAIRAQLRTQTSGEDREQLAQALSRLGLELVHRHPEHAPGAGNGGGANNQAATAAPLALGYVSAAEVARAEAALNAGASASAAPEIGSGAAAAGGSLLAGVLAFVVVLLYPRRAGLDSAEERRQLEASRRQPPREHEAPEAQVAPQPQGQRQPQAGPRPASGDRHADPPQQHRVNLHVQGDDITKDKEPNVAYNEPRPVTKAQGLAALDTIEAQCTKRQLRERNIAFERARRWVQTHVHTAPPIAMQTFQNPEVLRDDDRSKRRVDIEIVLGTAFV